MCSKDNGIEFGQNITVIWLGHANKCLFFSRLLATLIFTAHGGTVKENTCQVLGNGTARFICTCTMHSIVHNQYNYCELLPDL